GAGAGGDLGDAGVVEGGHGDQGDGVESAGGQSAGGDLDVGQLDGQAVVDVFGGGGQGGGRGFAGAELEAHLKTGVGRGGLDQVADRLAAFVAVSVQQLDARQ